MYLHLDHGDRTLHDLVDRPVGTSDLRDHRIVDLLHLAKAGRDPRLEGGVARPGLREAELGGDLGDGLVLIQCMVFVSRNLV